jgi:hypothetical protein
MAGVLSAANCPSTWLCQRIRFAYCLEARSVSLRAFGGQSLVRVDKLSGREPPVQAGAPASALRGRRETDDRTMLFAAEIHVRVN